MKKLLLALLAASACVGAQSATYNLDPLHTHVIFEIDHIISTNRGRFDRKEGAVEFDPQAQKGRVDLTVDMLSINTGVAPFNKQLQGKDFFNVEQFPTAKFTADDFVFSGDKVVEVNGNLTLVGKTNPVKLKALRFTCFENKMLKREVCGGDFEATITRSQWGMVWGIDRGFPDNLRLLIQVEGIKQ
ncbi:YceI family protein [Variovorax terrae]|uniref:YceI family protein n=1 Tax=Variovorax terrae TaxID=2923278 RepID=A0A9X1VQR8_9BURK|nr:YceI family protein [Variovorax terrae]MCJ0761623.1 YceI family protein [Variovorax terrae]